MQHYSNAFIPNFIVARKTSTIDHAESGTTQNKYLMVHNYTNFRRPNFNLDEARKYVQKKLKEIENSMKWSPKNRTVAGTLQTANETENIVYIDTLNTTHSSEPLLSLNNNTFQSTNETTVNITFAIGDLSHSSTTNSSFEEAKNISSKSSTSKSTSTKKKTSV